MSVKRSWVDGGMISQATIQALEAPGSGTDYILGCRMRRNKEVRDGVPGADEDLVQEVFFERQGSREPLVLELKEVRIEDRRYVVCYNPEQAKKDAADRPAIVESLKEKLKQGDKALVGNKRYRKYLKREGEQAAFSIDEDKLHEEARYDGLWVLRTNTRLSIDEVAFQYKQLWMVEQVFRSVKSVLETRPIYHKCDDTIRGHVFCSFLALVLMKELLSRLGAAGKNYEWEDIKRDLAALRELELRIHGMSLSAEDFIRRFFLHVLSDRLHRIRYYGFLGNRHRHEKLAQCRKLLGAPGATLQPPAGP